MTQPGKEPVGLTARALVLAESGLLALLALRLARRRHEERSVQDLTRRMIDATEDERRRIAQELHDDIGQRLSLISMQLSSLERLRSEDANDFREDLEDARRELDAVITDVHELSHTLHSATVTHLGLESAVRELARNIQRRHRIDVDLRSEAPGEVHPDVALCFYRITQEALNNVIRHSGSSRADLRLFGDGNQLKMRISDYGAGFDVAAVPAGLGLGTMKERALAIGGKVSVASKVGAGTTVSIEAPLQRVFPKETVEPV